MNYNTCAKQQPQCRGRNQGIKGFHKCVRDAGCSTKEKPPKGNWKLHLKQVRESNPDLTYRQAQKEASASYRKRTENIYYNKNFTAQDKKNLIKHIDNKIKEFKNIFDEILKPLKGKKEDSKDYETILNIAIKKANDVIKNKYFKSEAILMQEANKKYNERDEGLKFVYDLATKMNRAETTQINRVKRAKRVKV